MARRAERPRRVALAPQLGRKLGIFLAVYDVGQEREGTPALAGLWTGDIVIARHGHHEGQDAEPALELAQQGVDELELFRCARGGEIAGEEEKVGRPTEDI